MDPSPPKVVTLSGTQPTSCGLPKFLMCRTTMGFHPKIRPMVSETPVSIHQIGIRLTAVQLCNVSKMWVALWPCALIYTENGRSIPRPVKTNLKLSPPMLLLPRPMPMHVPSCIPRQSLTNGWKERRKQTPINFLLPRNKSHNFFHTPNFGVLFNHYHHPLSWRGWIIGRCHWSVVW